jgi:serine/threonine protein kinase
MADETRNSNQNIDQTLVASSSESGDFGGALELSPGQLVQERYLVKSEIGRGGMGVVYRVEQVVMGRDMALKTIDAKDIKDITWRRFQQEARATSLLDHPNLITVHDSGLLEGIHPYFVMDFVEGTTLADRIKRDGPLTVEEALPIFTQICFGMVHAHELGIIHRDLKPSNIMLVAPTAKSGAITVKVVDFGIAKLRGDEETQGLTRTGEVFGSPLYMSPEQCLGLGVDHRSDIYSFGCVLFESLAGLPPFLGSTALSTMMQHQTEKPPTLKEATLGKEFPAEIEQLLSKLLEKDPERRYQSFSSVGRDLSLLQQGISAQEIAGDRTFGFTDTNYPQHKSISVLSLALGCLLTALVTGASVWIYKDKVDTESFAKELDTRVARIKEKGQGHLIESKDPGLPYSKIVTIDGQKYRQFEFPSLIGVFNIVGHSVKKIAFGRYEIPFKDHIHLQVKGALELNEPGFFLRFMPDDITELTFSNDMVATDLPFANIGHLQSLNYLDINDIDISDAVIEQLNKLPSLTCLRIGGSGVTASGILQLTNLLKMTTLGIKDIDKPTLVLEKLRNSETIKMLECGTPALGEQDINLLTTMKNLEFLDFYGSSGVNDSSLLKLTKLKKLKLIDIRKTKVTAKSFPTFAKFDDIQTVKIDEALWTAAEREQFKKMYPKILLIVDHSKKFKDT